MADVFERTVGLTADEVARLEELDRLNPGGKDAALFAEAAALAGKAQRAAQARLGVVGGGPCRHCGTPLEANGTFEAVRRGTLEAFGGRPGETAITVATQSGPVVVTEEA